MSCRISQHYCCLTVLSDLSSSGHCKSLCLKLSWITVSVCWHNKITEYVSQILTSTINPNMYDYFIIFLPLSSLSTDSTWKHSCCAYVGQVCAHLWAPFPHDYPLKVESKCSFCAMSVPCSDIAQNGIPSKISLMLCLFCLKIVRQPLCDLKNKMLCVKREVQFKDVHATLK